MTWDDLDRLRKAQGLTKRELSRRAGRHERAFSSAMLGERGASSMSAWADFCRVLGVEAPWPGHTERDDPPWRHGTIAWEDLDRIREERGLSKSELSRMAGRGRKAFSHAMRCISGYRSEKAWADFARALGVSPDREEPPTPCERERIISQIRAAGLTPRDLAEETGYTASSIDKVLKGQRGGSAKMWREILTALEPMDTAGRPETPATGIPTSWEELDAIRKSIGLTMAELSSLAMRDEGSFELAMRGDPAHTTPSAWRAFCAALGVDAPPPGTPMWSCPPRSQREGAILKALAFDTSRARAEIPIPPRSTFVRGKRYEIRGSMRGSREADASWMSHTVVTYLRKEGVHHMFRGPGGWLTAWTDAQLVGKRVTSA
ncbi:MAG: transcriptional regulator [Synergistaceae bacterium]|nr:transcriptional regulator [Synergistaceae bacterium]